MHKIIFLLMLPLLLTAAEQPVPSTIHAVTVFLRGAQVERTAEAVVPAGRSVLRFSGISAQADPNSVRLSAVGSFTILSVTYEVNYLEPPVAGQERERLRAERDRLLALIRREEAALAVHAGEEALLEANRRLGGEQGGVSVEQLQALAAFYRERLSAIKLEKLDIEARISEQRAELTRIQKQLAAVEQGGEPKATGEVLVAVDAAGRTEASFRLGYLVEQAGWEPAYDLRVDDIAAPVQMDYRARIFQNSGEDWPQVQLTLSTGDPRASGNAPALRPWWLSPSPPVVYRQAPKQQADMARSFDPNAYEESVTIAGAPEVTQVERTTTVAFEVAEPYDIPAGGEPYAVAVAAYQLPATYEYYTVPKLDPAAFLRARLTGWEQYNLLSGAANLFLEGAFLGESYLDMDNVSDTLDLDLGRDPGIVIRRTKEKQFTDKQFIGNKQTRTVGWEIELRNTKSRPVTIVVEDQYPVSTSEEIEVELERAPGAERRENGILRWQLQLQPGRTETLAFRYAVKYPKRLDLRLE